MLIKRLNKIQFPISNFQFPKKMGFSLIELLVVISIIAVLSAVLVVNFMGMRERAKDAQKIQDLYAIKNALRIYYNDKQTYPAANILVSEIATTNYLPSIASIGYTYTVGADGDSFLLTVGLEAGAGDEDIQSQVKCGISPGVDKVFAVCAN